MQRWSFAKAVRFDVMIRLREATELGQRIESFAVDAWQGGAWAQIAQATIVGTCRLIRLTSPVETSKKLRLRINGVVECALPLLSLGFISSLLSFGGFRLVLAATLFP